MPNGERRLHQRCMARLEGIDIPHPFSIESFCRHLSAQRQRPLYLHPLRAQEAPEGACGMWLATATDDHVFYERRTAPLHQDHIVLHEIAHMLLEHGAQPSGTDLADHPHVRALLPDLDPHLVRRLIGRTNYTRVEELEAEMLATLMRTRHSEPLRSRPGDVLGNLAIALGVPRTPEA
ncbi:hypothetical protein [Streptomyces sp. NPDC049099]|uniref:hypothetical protein n=1 Tax=unclassified Streptomyces TaxID=2593676 RepID=UPI00342E5189